MTAAIKIVPLFVIVALAARMRRLSAADRHFLWLLFFLGAALLPFAAIALPAWLPFASTSKVTKAVYLTEVRVTQHVNIVYVWLAGVAFFLLRDAFALIASMRMTRGRTRIVIADRDVPPHTAFGRIVLPASARAWTRARFRSVMRHEIAHVRRRDFLTHVCARVVCAFYWFQPLIWIALRRLAIEQERACDDAVLAAGAPPDEYAAAVIDLVRVFRRAPAVSMASHLAHRIESILNAQSRRPRVGNRARSVFAVAIVTIALSLAPLQAGTWQAEITRSALATHIFAGDEGHFRMEFKDGSEVVLNGAASFGRTIADLDVERGSRVTIRGRGTEYVFEHDRAPHVDQDTRAWLDHVVARMRTVH
jgi:hypothetical protein